MEGADSASVVETVVLGEPGVMACSWVKHASVRDDGFDLT